MTTDIINVSADLSKVRSLTQTETHPVLASAASIVLVLVVVPGAVLGASLGRRMRKL